MATGKIITEDTMEIPGTRVTIVHAQGEGEGRRIFITQARIVVGGVDSNKPHLLRETRLFRSGAVLGDGWWPGQSIPTLEDGMDVLRSLVDYYQELNCIVIGGEAL